MKQLADRLVSAGVKVRLNESMARHTSIRVGGPADLYATAENKEQLERVYAYAEEAGVPVTLLGLGTNVVVGDNGIRGVVLVLGGAFRETRFLGLQVRAGAAVRLSALSRECASRGLTGLEFASGIPGTVGGAVAGNAGAYDGRISDVTESVCVFWPDERQAVWLSCAEMRFGYRYSVLQERPGAVLYLDARLGRGDPEASLRKIEEYSARRRKSQPLSYPSAGSVFKNPPRLSAGRLIEEAGLKGFSIGGATISTVHANFIVNTGNATAMDIKRLVEHVKNAVWERYGVRLQEEIRFVGD
ncbi:MAG: UDP-N-acetylmuramate dehydrogenase [Bacillota bacterium]